MKPVIWMHLVTVDGEQRIRAWTADAKRAAMFEAEGIVMTPLYAGNHVIHCDVHLPGDGSMEWPDLTILKGCQLSTVIAKLQNYENAPEAAQTFLPNVSQERA